MHVHASIHGFDRVLVATRTASDGLPGRPTIVIKGLDFDWFMSPAEAARLATAIEAELAGAAFSEEKRRQPLCLLESCDKHHERHAEEAPE